MVGRRATLANGENCEPRSASLTIVYANKLSRGSYEGNSEVELRHHAAYVDTAPLDRFLLFSSDRTRPVLSHRNDLLLFFTPGY
jgi:hypothetical protein